MAMVLTVQGRQLGDAQVSDRFAQLSFLIAADDSSLNLTHMHMHTHGAAARLHPKKKLRVWLMSGKGVPIFIWCDQQGSRIPGPIKS